MAAIKRANLFQHDSFLGFFLVYVKILVIKAVPSATQQINSGLLV